MKLNENLFIIFFFLSGLGSLAFPSTITRGFLFEDLSSNLKLKNGSIFRVGTTLNINAGSIIQEQTATITGVSSTSKISFTDGKLQYNETDFDINGDYLVTTSYLRLNGNGAFYSQLGSLPLSVLVSGVNNKLEGYPYFNSPLVLQDSNTTLSLGLQSNMNQNIVLNGATINLIDNLRFANATLITGSGKIVSRDNLILFGGVDSAWTSSITFSGQTDLRLNSRIDLSGLWTVTGYCSFHGAGNMIDLSRGGIIYIASGSTLNINDMGIEGLGTGKILFQDQTSKLNLQNTSITLDSNFSITTGGVYVDGNMLLVGQYLLEFSQRASLTVDGGTWWYDTLIYSDSANIRPTVADDVILTFSRGGVIRNAQSATTPAALFPTNNTEVNTNSVFDGQRILEFNKSASQVGVQQFAYDASNHEILFSRVEDTKMVLIGADTQVTFQNCVFRDFLPDYFSFESAPTVSTGRAIFGDQAIIELAASCDLDFTLTFSGNAVLDGKGQSLTFSNSGGIYVMPNSTLTIRDITIKGVGGTNISCFNNSASIIFNNVDLVHDFDFTFTIGSFQINNNLSLVGTSTFFYQTNSTSTIMNNGTLFLDQGMTFRYCPSISNQNLIAFEDSTGRVYMNGATLSSSRVGLNLITGNVIFNDDNYIVSDAILASQAIKIGNGLMDGNDLFGKISTGANITLLTGYLDI